MAPGGTSPPTAHCIPTTATATFPANGHVPDHGNDHDHEAARPGTGSSTRYHPLRIATPAEHI